jgi:hypothetical protein
MSSWSPDTITAIAASDDLHIAPLRGDGTTYGTPTWIWSVVVDGELYVRAYNGTASRWYGSAMRQRAGRIAAAGGSHEVDFEPAEPSVHDAVDAAYEAKYAGSPYLLPMVTPKTRAATVRIAPRA